MSDPAKCLECGGVTHPIRVLDQGHLDQHKDPEYTVLDSKKEWLSGRFPVKGRLTAELCDSCGRVVFRAAPVVYRAVDEGLKQR